MSDDIRDQLELERLRAGNRPAEGSAEPTVSVPAPSPRVELRCRVCKAQLWMDPVWVKGDVGESARGALGLHPGKTLACPCCRSLLSVARRPPFETHTIVPK